MRKAGRWEGVATGWREVAVLAEGCWATADSVQATTKLYKIE
jgi:hypothetical protein